VGVPEDKPTIETMGMTDVKNSDRRLRESISEMAILERISITGRAKTTDMAGVASRELLLKTVARYEIITHKNTKDKKETIPVVPPKSDENISPRNALGDSRSGSVSADISMPSGTRNKKSFISSSISVPTVDLRVKTVFLKTIVVIFSIF
jgi:hypothetical protein